MRNYGQLSHTQKITLEANKCLHLMRRQKLCGNSDKKKQKTVR